MEIISFVQQSKKRSAVSFFKDTLGNINLPKTQRKYTSAVAYSYAYPTEKNVFRAGVVNREFSIRNIFCDIGQGVSDCCEFIKTNIKKIVICLFAVCFVVFGCVAGFSVYNYYQNHTNEITLNYESELDIQEIDNYMLAFALEKTNDAADSNVELNEANINLSASILSKPVEYQTYKVKSGDTISGIASKFNLSNISTLISVNDIGNVRQIGAGQKLKIPSIDGIIYTVKDGDSLDAIANANNIKLEDLVDVNELNTDILTKGQQLFLPGVSLDKETLQSRMGELFILPIKASFKWSSPYGWRADPFTGVRSFHTGTDMACPEGTPILSVMSGKISEVGFNRTYGNYIIINHSNGYQTVYAHMSKTIAKKGQSVTQGQTIGLVGSTGYSTGPHLHFMVYKNGTRIDPSTVLKQ